MITREEEEQENTDVYFLDLNTTWEMKIPRVGGTHTEYGV